MKTPTLVRAKLTLRLPVELHQRLSDAAVDNGRSLTSEIVQRLKQSFGAAGVNPTNSPERTHEP
jgi:predicted HicB family RNase H-like nuclease